MLHLSLYLIEILHQTTTPVESLATLLCCILSKFYIKPQRRSCTAEKALGCILSKFYIKPQPYLQGLRHRQRCILSKFYIKPQHCRRWRGYNEVVSYRNSTSNHNNSAGQISLIMLYLIEILHQTTTLCCPIVI